MHCGIQSVHVALQDFNNFQLYCGKGNNIIGFKISFDVQYFQLSFFRPVEPLYKRVATFKLYVLPLSQFGKK